MHVRHFGIEKCIVCKAWVKKADATCKPGMPTNQHFHLCTEEQLDADGTNENFQKSMTVTSNNVKLNPTGFSDMVTGVKTHTKQVMHPLVLCPYAPPTQNPGIIRV